MDCSMPGFPLLHYYPKYDHPLVAQRVKHLPAMQETWVPSLGREDTLEKEMATHSSTLAWKTPWTEEPSGLQSQGLAKSWTQLSDKYCTFLFTFIQFNSVTQLCLILCDPMDCSTPGFPFITNYQTHVHQVSDAIQPSHLLLPSSAPASNLSQHQTLFQWVSSSHQVAKVLEFQLQRQSFQCIFRLDFL